MADGLLRGLGNRRDAGHGGDCVQWICQRHRSAWQRERLESCPLLCCWKAARSWTTKSKLQPNGMCLSRPYSEGPACQVRCSTFDNPFGSVVLRSIIHSHSPGTTSVPLRPSQNLSRRDLPRWDLLLTSLFEGTCLSRPCSEGPACQVRVFGP
jgi:hypothetical protein